MSIDFTLEWVATILSLVFLTGIIRRKIWAWPAGTLSSILSVALFYRTGLYAESGLYFFYVILGIYGWWHWKQNAQLDTVELVTISSCFFFSQLADCVLKTDLSSATFIAFWYTSRI